MAFPARLFFGSRRFFRCFDVMRAVFLALVFLVSASPAFSAGELVMFNSSYCDWCELWEQEVGVVYEKTSEARIAPVRRVDIHDARPDDLKWIKRVVYTPTFVLINGGKEVGRINGYPGEGFFWGLLDEMVDKLAIPLRACDEKRKMASAAPEAEKGSLSC